jgi:very-short-patch-repair endonuclease
VGKVISAYNDKLKLFKDKINKELSQVANLDISLMNILKHARRFSNADAGSIYLRTGNWLHFSYTQNETLQSRLPPGEKLIFSSFNIPIDEKSIAGFVATNKKILNIHDVYKLDPKLPYTFSKKFDDTFEYRTKSILTVPIESDDGSLLGIMQLINAKDSSGRITHFSEDDEKAICQFCSLAAEALCGEKYYNLALHHIEKKEFFNAAQFMFRAARIGHKSAREWTLKENSLKPLEAERLYQLGLYYDRPSLSIPFMEQASALGHEGAKKKLNGVLMEDSGSQIDNQNFSMDTTSTIDEAIRKRLINVLEYIEEVEKIGSKVALRVADHKRPAFFEHQLQNLPGIHFGDPADNTIWLEIRRLQPIDPPLPEGEILRSLLSVPSNPSMDPVFNEEMFSSMLEDPNVEYDDIIDEDRILKEWGDFIDGPYKQWRESEAPRRKTIQVYATLFGLKRAMEIDSASDPIELVWGIGVASWRVQENIIEYPILLQGVELAIDNRSRNILVIPRESEPIVEMAPFSALRNEGTIGARKSALEFLEELDRPLSPFDDSSFTGALNACISALDSTGFFWDKNSQDPPSAKPPRVTDRLMVSNTWVIFVRPKTAHFLLQDLERLRETAKVLKDLPAGPYALFKEPSTEPSIFSRIPFRGVSSPNPESIADREPEDLYFPKPYNYEQMQIVERLEQAPGVVAQGPPGTGKTHTIANIICHYLAKGRSILVTSKGEHALRVLKDKLPEGIRPLAVSLLSSDREALKEMEHAVDKILQRLQAIDQQGLRREIDAGHRQADLLCATVARAEKEIADWARKQLAQVTYEGKALIPGELARILVRDRDVHSWLPSPVIWDEDPFPISEKEIQRMRELRRGAGERLKCHGWPLPVTGDLPNADSFVELHNALARRKSLAVSAKSDDLPMPRRDFSVDGLKLARQLRKVLIIARKILGYKLKDDRKWLAKLVSISEKNSEVWESDGILEKLNLLFKDVANLEKDRCELLGYPVDIPGDAFNDVKFIAAVNRQAKGQQPFSVLIGLTKGKLKKWLKEVRLLDRQPSGKQDWIFVQRHIDYAQASRAMIARWNAFMQEFNGPLFKDASNENIKKMAREAVRAQEVFFYCRKGRPYIIRILPKVFNDPNGNAKNINSINFVDKYISALDIQLHQGELRAAVDTIDRLKRLLGKHKNTLCDSILQLVEFQLGDAGMDEEKLFQEYKRLLEELDTLHNMQPIFSEIKQLSSKFEKCGAKQWARALLNEPVGAQTDRLLPSNWREGVEWHRFMNYLEIIDGQHRLQELAEELRKTEKRLAQTQERLVENITWLGMTGISEQYQRALRQYAIAVSRIGAGKGKVRTPRYRREAREAMKKAVGAVPCWIMPHWRISETLPAEIGRFDLVIIDEASQSDIWALPALLRGKKILVVGDDKQVSPSLIGKSEEALVNLSNQYLKGFDLGKQMGPESSIYDLAQVAFAADNICLCEHFRCAEPIITFSDRNWYNCLITVRVPLPSERIDPPLVDVYVKDGYRDGRKKINVPEAHAIVDEIKALVEDPVFNRRTIGVISMLGQGAQAKYIASLLFETIGEEIINKHDIICGDPSSFQGNERDIIFLSLVDDSDHLRTRADRSSAQRFNVAASRAKDRMYLFRSFRRDDLRSSNDLRSRLIDHFRNPIAQKRMKVETLRELCESDFEERIFDALVARGYHVVPQVPAGGFRIDLVVEGPENRRLAIECDGARYHGPDRYFDDLNRQRILERVGWTFWRCWGSTFYREPERILANLFDTLADMGITPIGGDMEFQSGIAEFREVCGLTYNKEIDSRVQRELEITVDDGVTHITPKESRPTYADMETSRQYQRDDTQSKKQEFQDTLFEQDGLEQKTDLPITTSSDHFDEDEKSYTAATLDKPIIKCVEPEDSVIYCFMDNKEEVKTVQIVKGSNQPSMGIINVNAPLARAFLGAEEGSKVEVRLPTGVKIAKILSVEKGQ